MNFYNNSEKLIYIEKYIKYFTFYSLLTESKSKPGVLQGKPKPKRYALNKINKTYESMTIPKNSNILKLYFD